MAFPAQGLYDPAQEHDACGMGFIVNLSGARSQQIIRSGLEILIHLAHRGACGCDPETGDGAGILIQIPHEFFVRELPFALPERGRYGAGMMFLPVDARERLVCEGIVEAAAREQGLKVLGWRDTPVRADAIGRQAPPRLRWPARKFVKKSFFTSPRFRRGPWCTRACCWRRRSPIFTASCAIRTRAAPSAWCTSVFRRTRFRAGSLRIRTGCCATTARSTRFAAISTG